MKTNLATRPVGKQKPIKNEVALKAALKKAEAEVEKKKKELIKIKEIHRKVAGEFIDVWLIANRIRKSLSLKKKPPGINER